jgi:hypothetical protein
MEWNAEDDSALKGARVFFKQVAAKGREEFQFFFARGFVLIDVGCRPVELDRCVSEHDDPAFGAEPGEL